MNKPKLTYFNFPGVAESTRLALRLGGIEFDDIFVDHDQMQKMKANEELPGGQVPLLEVDGAKISQSGAILHWAGKLTGLYPEDVLLAARCDMVLCALTDMRRYLNPHIYGHVLGRSPLTSQLLVPLSDEQKQEIINLLNTEVFPVQFGLLEKILGSSRFFCGDKITICDLELYSIGRQVLAGTWSKGVQPAVLDNCPRLKQLILRVGEALDTD